MRFGAQPWSQAPDWPGLRDVLVIDEVDATEAGAVNASGVRARVAQTLIGEEKERRRLAQEILELVGALPLTS